VETDHAPDSLFGRIFNGKPVSTFPENALMGSGRLLPLLPTIGGMARSRNEC
jgi:hypothetical protein